jgi:hypothetical protein
METLWLQVTDPALLSQPRYVLLYSILLLKGELVEAAIAAVSAFVMRHGARNPRMHAKEMRRALLMTISLVAQVGPILVNSTHVASGVLESRSITRPVLDNLLARVDAQIALMEQIWGVGQPWDPDLQPSEMCTMLAKSGRLAAALKLCRAQKLDEWTFAYEPFVELCINIEKRPGESDYSPLLLKGLALHDIFDNCDGYAALMPKVGDALWSSLASAVDPNGECLPTARTLFAQVAEKCLACDLPIPWCVLKHLQEDNHWHRLLRVYIEFDCLDKAVELASAKLETVKTEQVVKGPRRDIPIALLLSLKDVLEQRGSPHASRMTTMLDRLSEDCENARSYGIRMEGPCAAGDLTRKVSLGFQPLARLPLN